MYCTRKVTDKIYWIGGDDRRIALFENVYPVPGGVSYNAYFVSDEKTMVIDTVDHSVSKVFFENIAHELDGRDLDYLVVNHMEPDHAATIGELILRYPKATIVCNQKIAVMLKQFFDFDVDSRAQIVKEGDTLSTGEHTFTFVMAPMVHWPEVMMTYEISHKILFSADAFGTFGALNGHLFADEVNFEADYLAEARRYYTNIVGKYGTQVQAVLKKAAGIEIEMICPLHGFVWRKNIGDFVDKYMKWSTYTPEQQGVLIAYASVYGNTENVAGIIACKLAEAGKKVVMYDVSATHPSYIVAEAFRYSHMVLVSTTYNAGIFVNMENLVRDLAHHNLQNRTVALVENGSWAPTAAGLMKCELSGLKNMTFLENTLTIRSALKSGQMDQLNALVEEILDSMREPEEEGDKEAMVEPNALFKLSYGLFVLTAKDGGKDNGCIINTVTQLTDTPKRITIAVNKANYTHDMIQKTGVFNVSVLSEDVPFKIFQQFGFQSGRDADKFAGMATQTRSANGLRYLDEYTNAFISAKVISAEDYGTHTLFVADITEAKVLSAEPSVTYAYYFEHIKPKPQPTTEAKKGWVCKICGYVYEGEDLPADFICPLCKHGAEDFEPLK
ncbi:MAG TPA: flavin reductase [Candidatus Faecaligallichristensenella faecipullorum]|nr:flavin reductase [Candidatus Faecaligallichristensenella faecipullorum]